MTKKTTGNNGIDDQTDKNTLERIIPLSKWHEHHPWPPLGGMRHIRFYQEEKNAAHCFVKKGNRVLVRERKFLEWLSTSDAA